MEIPEIKSQLPLSELITHYRLNPDKQNRIHCPFHEDKTPSMQLYWKTNTAYCFSSNCKTHGKSIDVIDFIMYMEGFDKLSPHAAKHEAIQKTITIINGNMPQTNITSQQTRTAILTKMFSYFKNAVHNSPPAKEYLKSRNIDYTKLEIGYNSGQFHHAGRSKDEALIKSCLQVGLLYESGTSNKGVRQYGTFGKYCIVFPLKNKEQNITGLYFRSTMNDTNQRHYYLKNREGLYPNYPDSNIKKLILTESIIDAATLLQQDEITAQYNIIALYGTNGLTEEHTAAITELKHLDEIIFFLNGDEPGRTAVKKHSEILHKLLNFPPAGGNTKGVTISNIEPPEGEDVNSLLQGHAPDIFTEMINKRRVLSQIAGNFLFSNEKPVVSGVEPPNEKEKTESSEILPKSEEETQQHENQSDIKLNGTPIKPMVTEQNKNESSNLQINSSANSQISTSSNHLITTNPYKIAYKTETAQYYIQGGISKSLDSMKITLVIEHLKTKQKSRNKVDLYEDKQVEKLCKDASEKLDLRKDLLETDIYKLTDLLEPYREQQIANETERPQQSNYTMSRQEKNEAYDLAGDKNLIEKIGAKLTQSGITGEEKSKVFLFAIAASHIQENPLNALIQGSSGSGKTKLLKQIFSCMPEENRKIYSRLSEKMLFNVPQYYFKNKLVCFEDVDGLGEEAEYAWRELVSNGVLISGVSYKDEKGNISVKELIVYGPIASIACTTRGSVYADNMSRLFLIAIDESAEQTRRINDYQAKEASGLLNKQEQKQTILELQNFVRLLQPCEVHNPHATMLKLPEGIQDERRLYRLYLYFIDMITVLHQYQRKKNGHGKLLATKQDCQISKDLMFECIMLKMDELYGSLRQFFERLKEFIKTKNNDKYSFTQREIREALKVSKTHLFRFMTELTFLEYIQENKYNGNHGNTYQIRYWDDYKKVREEVKKFLQNQIDSLPEE